MPYGGRRRRSEWDHGGQWQWRPAGAGRGPWNSRRNFDVHRGEDLLSNYRMAGFNNAYRAQVPEFQGVPATKTVCTERPWNATNTMTPSSKQMMLVCDGIGRGSFNVPEAAPALPPPISMEVMCIIDNMLRLQRMAPEQAAKILKDNASLQGAYED